MADAPIEDNLADARRLAVLMRTIDTCPKPTVVRIDGLAFAGAVGLVACCDIAVAAVEAEFAVSEVRLGLIPSVIGPYLVRAVGAIAFTVMPCLAHSVASTRVSESVAPFEAQ